MRPGQASGWPRPMSFQGTCGENLEKDHIFKPLRLPVEAENEGTCTWQESRDCVVLGAVLACSQEPRAENPV